MANGYDLDLHLHGSQRLFVHDRSFFHCAEVFSFCVIKVNEGQLTWKSCPIITVGTLQICSSKNDLFGLHFR